MASEKATVAVIGLGNMGSPMSRHLLAAGFAVQGYDVRQEAATALEDAGGRAAASPGEAADSADVVITSLPSVAALRAVVNASDGLAAAASPGLIVVETSTLPLDEKEAARQVLAQAGAAILDCPLSPPASQMRTPDAAGSAHGHPAPPGRCRALPPSFPT